MSGWTIPRMWEGHTVAILASGESMSAEVAEMVRGRCRAIAVNNTFLLAPWADLLFAADGAWWQFHRKKASEFAGLKVCAEEQAPYPGVLCIKESGKEGFDPNPAAIRTGGNGGSSSIHIAAHAGASRILLCGFDMHGGHWHGVHPSPLREHGPATFTKWIARFATLAPELAKRGIEVINCTEGSALKVWSFVPLEESLAARAIAVA